MSSYFMACTTYFTACCNSMCNALQWLTKLFIYTKYSKQPCNSSQNICFIYYIYYFSDLFYYYSKACAMALKVLICFCLEIDNCE